ncbi:MAG: ABC transporter permease [Nocardioidaceae bacterium]|nr:MAG: ABC transporter permease [Nocardioidaceae bacterium]
MTTSPETTDTVGSARRPNPGRAILHGLSPKRVSALYVLVVIVLLFSFWVPETFPRMATVQQILNGNAVIGMAALSIVIPLSARVFDLSFAYTMSLSGVTAAHLIANRDWSLPSALLAALGIALVVGFINAIVVVVLRVDSLIGTLATGSIIQAFITFVTKEIPITDSKLVGGFSEIGQRQIFGLILPVWYMLGFAIILWFFLEHTAVGRRIYATGFNTEAARLTGIRTKRIQFCSLLVSAVIAGWAGIALAGILGSGSPTAGTPYLLPAFAAAFLGATQITPGRFNARGTVLGVITLGTGITGLSLATAPAWASNMFTGIVLIAALAVTTVQRKPRSRPRRFALRRSAA